MAGTLSPSGPKDGKSRGRWGAIAGPILGADMTYTRRVLAGALLTLFLAAPTLVPAQWIQCGLNGINVSALEIKGSNLYAGTVQGLYRSTDYGTTWDLLNLGRANVYISSFAVDDTELFAGGSDLYRSTDDGLHWMVVDSTLGGVTSVAVSGDHLLAGTSSSGIYGSSDQGKSWRAENLGITDGYITALAIIDSTTYAGTEWDSHPQQGGHVFISTNFGENWTLSSTGLPDRIINQLRPVGNAIFVCLNDYGGLYRSTDGGRQWLSANNGLSRIVPQCITGIGTDFCLGGGFPYTTDCIYRLSSPGASWSLFSTGIEATDVLDLKILGPYLFAATAIATPGKNGVWRRAVSDLTGIQSAPAMPNAYTLDQNYPNPFNPTTTIQFGIPKQTYVTLKIFDLLGRKVADLISSDLPLGRYSCKWDARGISSGVFFCELRCGNVALARKLILAK